MACSRGTGNPHPEFPNTDAGDNLYTDSVVALDADTGRLEIPISNSLLTTNGKPCERNVDLPTLDGRGGFDVA